jgi:ubiquitin-protein ligase
LKELRDAKVPLCGVSAAPLDNSIYTWHANLRGPEQSAFKGGVFHLEMVFPTNYPVSPPTVTFFTEVPHPNVFGKTVCLDMLQKQPAKGGESWEGWTSAYTVESVLLQLQSFLLEAPLEVGGNEAGWGGTQSVSGAGDGRLSPREAMRSRDSRAKYKKAVDEANAYKCTLCPHRGPIEPYPKFHEKDQDIDQYVLVDAEAKELLRDEFLCYHSRTRLAEASLGIGISIARLPRTGEIRSVQPTLDLLCLRAFTKQKVRQSAANERFTHWLPLFFGERDDYEVKI